MLRLPFRQNHNPGDLVLGRLGKYRFSPRFRVSASARTAHLHVIGVSGTGKSKLLEWCLYQDIAAGRGCGLIDPDSLLVDDLICLLLTNRTLENTNIRREIIYVDQARTGFSIR
jgi:hypothetical protein